MNPFKAALLTACANLETAKTAGNAEEIKTARKELGKAVRIYLAAADKGIR